MRRFNNMRNVLFAGLLAVPLFAGAAAASAYSTGRLGAPPAGSSSVRSASWRAQSWALRLDRRSHRAGACGIVGITPPIAAIAVITEMLDRIVRRSHKGAWTGATAAS